MDIKQFYLAYDNPDVIVNSQNYVIIERKNCAGNESGTRFDKNDAVYDSSSNDTNQVSDKRDVEFDGYSAVAQDIVQRAMTQVQLGSEDDKDSNVGIWGSSDKDACRHARVTLFMEDEGGRGGGEGGGGGGKRRGVKRRKGGGKEDLEEKLENGELSAKTEKEEEEIPESKAKRREREEKKGKGINRGAASDAEAETNKENNKTGKMGETEDIRSAGNEAPKKLEEEEEEENEEMEKNDSAITFLHNSAVSSASPTRPDGFPNKPFISHIHNDDTSLTQESTVTPSPSSNRLPIVNCLSTTDASVALTTPKHTVMENGAILSRDFDAGMPGRASSTSSAASSKSTSPFCVEDEPCFSFRLKRVPVQSVLSNSSPGHGGRSGRDGREGRRGMDADAGCAVPQSDLTEKRVFHTPVRHEHDFMFPCATKDAHDGKIMPVLVTESPIE